MPAGTPPGAGRADHGRDRYSAGPSPGRVRSRRQRASYALRPDAWGSETMTDSDGAEIARLAALSPLEYEREREAAAQRLGCRVTMLDRLVKAERPQTSGDVAPKCGADSGSGAGRALANPELDPWPEPVDGSALLDDLAATIRRYLVLEGTAADAVALWIMHTYAIDAAYVSPRLAITSPEKRCGKTTLLTLLRALVAKPLATANVTAAVLFRAIEAVKPTLLIDEADTFIGGADGLRGIINAGHSRGTATVLRSAPDGGDGWEPRGFNVWGALAIAMIGRPHGTIEDRSINVALRRRRPDETVQQLRIDRLHQLAPLGRRAARWADDHHAALSQADPDVPAELHDRAADNWRPLLAIADAVGSEWPQRARRAALALTCDGATDGDASGIALLADLRELFAMEPRGVLFTAEIVTALHGREDRPWAEYQRGRPITAHQVAALLRPLGVSTNQTVRRGQRTAKGYRGKDFADAWARYLPPQGSVTGSQAADSMASGDGRSVTPDGNVTGEGSVT